MGFFKKNKIKGEHKLKKNSDNNSETKIKFTLGSHEDGSLIEISWLDFKSTVLKNAKDGTPAMDAFKRTFYAGYYSSSMLIGKLTQSALSEYKNLIEKKES